MTSPAITVTARTTVKDGLRLLDEHRVTSLPVIDAEGQILGVVSEIDLLRGAVRHDPRAHMLAHQNVDKHPSRVEDVMTTPAMTVAGDSDLSEAVALMASTVVKSFPVIDSGRVVGVVSRSDVVHLLARSDQQIASETGDLLRSAGMVCAVEVVDGIVRLDGLEDPTEWRAAEAIAGSVAGVISVQIPR